MRQTLLLALLSGALVLAGCATSSKSNNQPSQKEAVPGFIDDYSLLKTVATDSDDIKLFRYVNPNFKRSDYHAVIIEPVIINQNTEESGVRPEILAQTRDALDKYLRGEASKRFNVTNTPGPGVARLKVVITGAELEGDGFKPRYLIPISAVLHLATMASGYDNKRAVLEIASKITDSQSNQLLGASVATINGEKFRNEVNTPEEFQALAKSYVDKTTKAAAGLAGN